VVAVAFTMFFAACGGNTTRPTAPRVADQSSAAPSSPVPTRSVPPAAPATATLAPSPTGVTLRRVTATAIAASSTATAIQEPTSTSTTAPEPCPGAIAWDAAAEHVGQIVTVRGPVVDATYASDSRGQPTFLNIGRGYPDPARFTVVIWIPNRANFPAPPEELYSGQTVCVTGQITLYNGSAEMEIIGPEDIVTS
jgi:hypothetical protein